VTLKDADGRHVSVSSRNLDRWPVANATINGLRRVALAVRLAPDADVAKAKSALLGALADVEGISHDPAPEAHVSALDTAGVELIVTAWVPPQSVADGQEAALLAVHDAAKRAKIALLSATPNKD